MSISKALRNSILAALVVLASPAIAQNLRVGLAVEPDSLDPQYHQFSPNNAIGRHLYDRLVHQDKDQRLTPGLAVSWRATSPTVWEFALRQGVRFHDGTPFEAADVAFSIDRARKVEKSPSSFAPYLRSIASVDIDGAHLVRITTREPNPTLPTDLSVIAILSAKLHAETKQEEFAAGKLAVGTGPYRFTSWSRGDRLTFERNDSYWGGAAPWARVEFRMLTADATRVAALLADSVDIIENVPPASLASLRANARFRVAAAPSNRLLFLSLDSARDQTPFATDLDGKPLPANPFKDARVRKAFSLAIAREALADRVLEGVGSPAAQLVPPGFFGHDPALKPAAQDFDAARKLLAEAGYPNGFGVTLHGPTNRYVGDIAAAQAVAQMLTRIGVQTKVETMPPSIFLTRSAVPDFSFILIGYAAVSGEASSALRVLIHSFDRERGLGANNRGRFADPAIDETIRKALVEVDDATREKMLQAATKAAMDQAAIIPLIHYTNFWASKAEIAYEGRADEYTLAMSARPRN
ncbi:MAG: ABC transporter substrate-binding protein [Alphaproteobacteria bacterium]|nr:ABC transporter substrate-binding protein [Alphaproteobacteria bacterium]